LENGDFIIKAGDGIERRVTSSCVKTRSDIDMSKIRSVKNTRRILLIHGTEDTIVPYHDSELMFQQIPADKGLFLTKNGASHFFYDDPRHLDELIEDIKGFLLREVETFSE